MNILQYSQEQSGLGHFPAEFAYDSQTSPSNSISSDGSDQRRINDLDPINLMDNWAGTGDFNDCNDVKIVLDVAENAESDQSKQVVVFHHLPRNICPTICVVCGDRATGYHYEVPSCNGCKTFFRRTILSQRKYECSRGGTCFNILPKEKRCSCRSCRFAKCVEVGMNPYAIQTPDKLDENQIVSKIAAKRKVPDELAVLPSTSKSMVPVSVLSMDQSIEKLIDGLMYLEIKVENFRACTYNPPCEEFSRLDVLLDKHSLIPVADKLGPMKSWPISPMSHEEFHAFRKQGCVEPFSPERKNWFVYDILTSVEYAKTFMFMHQLCKSDQILLLRAVTLKLMNLQQSFYSYEKKFGGILHPDGTTPGQPKGLIRHIGEDRVEKSRKEWLTVINMLMSNKLDKQEYVLFKAITLCNATIDGLTQHAQDVVTREKEKFSKALLNYCLAKRGPNGPAHYAACLAFSNGLESHQKNQKDMHCLIKLSKGRHGPFPHHELVDDVMEEI